KTLTKAIRRGRELGIKVIFVQKQFPVNTVTPIARALGARVVMIDPLAEDYLENLRRMTRALKEAMH
ncbi:MAG: metal ABC transporter solute-binding protein, Zn/Mn family, partial [Nitrospinaceae bacterium]